MVNYRCNKCKALWSEKIIKELGACPHCKNDDLKKEKEGN